MGQDCARNADEDGTEVKSYFCCGAKPSDEKLQMENSLSSLKPSRTISPMLTAANDLRK